MDTDIIIDNNKFDNVRCKICNKPAKRFSSYEGVYCSKECRNVIVI